MPRVGILGLSIISKDLLRRLIFNCVVCCDIFQASLLGAPQCSSSVSASSAAQSSLQIAASASKSTSNLIASSVVSPVEVGVGKLSISAASLEQNGVRADGEHGESEASTMKVWCV